MPAAAIQLAFVPGILSTCAGWNKVVPDGAQLAPVEYAPAAPGSVAPAGEAGDFVGIMALRLLTAVLRLGEAGPWALGGHSAGGTVVYQCLDLLADLHEPGGAAQVLDRARGSLGADDLAALARALDSLAGAPPRLPVAAFSFEGSLMSCDVLGWAEKWQDMATPPTDEGKWIEEALHNPASHWTWEMTRLDCGALVARCASDPPVHLASLERWLQLPSSPGFVYVAGAKSAKRNQVVFPALQEMGNRSGQISKLRLLELPGAGHNMASDAPELVRAAIAEELGLSLRDASAPRVAAVSMATAGAAPQLHGLAEAARLRPAALLAVIAALAASAGLAAAALCRGRRAAAAWVQLTHR